VLGPSSIVLATIVIAIALPVSILVIWVGLLYHRVLTLTIDQREHGLNVLKQFTALVRVGTAARTSKTTATEKRSLRGRAQG